MYVFQFWYKANPKEGLLVVVAFPAPPFAQGALT